MTYEVRDKVDYFFGTLSSPASISATTLSAAAFSSLPTGVYGAGTPGIYLPLVIHDPAQGLDEIVWVTGHTSSPATDVTVVRGREGTTARAWNAGTQVTCAPTKRDVLATYASGSLPSDAHTGMQIMTTDFKQALEKTPAAGWQATVGLARSQEVGRTQAGALPPTNATIITRTGYQQQTGNSGGDANFTFEAPFPNGVLSVILQNCSTSFTLHMAVIAQSVSGFTVRTWTASSPASPAVTPTVPIFYLATGW